MKLNKLLLTATCLLMPFSVWAGGSAFINPVIVLQKAPQAIQASQAMKEEFKAREVELGTLLEALRKQEEDYQKNSSIMSEVKRKSAEEDIIAKQREFQFAQQSLKEDIVVTRKKTIAALKKTITDVIKTYGKQKGYDFIFSEGVAYADESVDITDEILEELKKLDK